MGGDEITGTLSLPARLAMSATAGMVAATCCHPLDVVRVQLQVDATGEYKSMMDAARGVVRKQGARGLYAGLSAAYLRQWLYGSFRMGIYSELLIRGRAALPDGEQPSMLAKMSYGLASGTIGSFCGNPTEIALVRMSADSKAPAAERRNYKNVFDCIARMLREEGPSSMLTGVVPTMVRAGTLAAMLMATTSQCKEYAVERKWFSADSLVLTFGATTIGSLVGNTCIMPLDVIKSRVQNMKRPLPGQAPQYAGMIDCGRKLVAQEGVAVLWRGFVPAFIKLAPYSIISLTALDLMTKSLTGKSAL